MLLCDPSPKYVSQIANKVVKIPRMAIGVGSLQKQVQRHKYNQSPVATSQNLYSNSMNSKHMAAQRMKGAFHFLERRQSSIGNTGKLDHRRGSWDSCSGLCETHWWSISFLIALCVDGGNCPFNWHELVFYVA